MTFIRNLIIACILAAIAWFIYPVINTNQLNVQLVMSIAVFISVLAGSLIAGCSAGGKEISVSSNGANKTIFVGNLAFRARKDDLQKLFSEYGQVNSVRIMTDRETRKPRGFGFIEMSESDAARAIKALDGFEFMGRNLKVNEANERKDG